MSDQHNRRLAGCYGHDIVKTPNLDRMSRDGTRFDAAYTPCPVCVPARASFATGKYVHQIGLWDNAMPFDGTMASWHSLLRDRGHQVVSIGKLHFHSADDDNGFSDEQIGMHIIEGDGDLLGLVRDEDMPKRAGAYKMAKMAGPGESLYTTYDREIAARAQVWLREEAGKFTEKPWVLFVSFVCPHFPLTAPPEFFYPYYDQDLPEPKLYAMRDKPLHPFLRTTAHPSPMTISLKTRIWSSARRPDIWACAVSSITILVMSCRRWATPASAAIRASYTPPIMVTI
jgi:choline-sulfatase